MAFVRVGGPWGIRIGVWDCFQFEKYRHNINQTRLDSSHQTNIEYLLYEATTDSKVLEKYLDAFKVRKTQ